MKLKYIVIAVISALLVYFFYPSVGSEDLVQNNLNSDNKASTTPPSPSKTKTVSSTGSSIAPDTPPSLEQCNSIKTKLDDAFIKDVLVAKLNEGHDKELLTWFAEQIHLKNLPKTIKKIHKRSATLDNPSYEYLTHLNLFKLNEAFANHNYDYVLKIWNEFSSLATNKFQLSRFSRFLNMGRLFRNSDNEQLIQQFDYLKSIGAPIDPYLLLSFKNGDISFFENMINHYDIDIANHVKNLRPIKELLRASLRLPSTGLFEYLMKYHGKPADLTASFDNFSYSKADRTIPLLELLWSFGGRPDYKFKSSIPKLELFYPNASILNKIKHWYATEELDFPFDEEIRWQYDELVSEIMPFVKEHLEQVKESKSQCFQEKYGFLDVSLEEVKSTALIHFQNGLSLQEIEQSFFQQSRWQVQLFRDVFSAHYVNTCHWDASMPQSDVVDELLSGEINLYDCIGFSGPYLLMLLRHTRQYIPGYTVEEFLLLLDPPDWENFEIPARYMGVVLNSMNVFTSLNWPTDHVDYKNKTFIYNAIAWKKYDIAKLLSENNTLLDADAYGFDGLDYFLVNAFKYENKKDWIKIFITASWPVRESHEKFFDRARDKFTSDELAMLENLIFKE